MEESQQTSTHIDKAKALLNKFPLITRLTFVVIATCLAIFGLQKWDDYREGLPSGSHAQIQEILPDPETNKVLMHVPVSYIQISEGPRILHPNEVFSCVDNNLVIHISGGGGVSTDNGMEIHFTDGGDISTNVECATGFFEYSYHKGDNDPILPIIGNGADASLPPTDANLGYQGEEVVPTSINQE